MVDGFCVMTAKIHQYGYFSAIITKLCYNYNKMKPRIKFTIITLFAEALKPYLDSSMLYKAQERGIIEINYVNLRDFGVGPHKSVDDTPYGGGDGMLLRCEPVFAAIESIKETDPTAQVILPTPVGEVWNQALAREFAGINQEKAYHDDENADLGAKNGNSSHKTTISGSASAKKRSQTRVEALEASIAQKWDKIKVMAKNASEGEFEASNAKTLETDISKESKTPKTGATDCETRHYIILCPHYEGYDERIMSIVDYPISLGNYVLTGGELPALIIIDSVTRLLPGVLGGASSAEIESFSDGDNLEFPQYTKPAEFRGMSVPEVLLSGHHGKVAEWREQQMRRRGD